MRKNAAMLKSTPIKLDKNARDFIAKVKTMPVAPGCEVQHERYLAAVVTAEESHARLEAIYRQCEKEGGTSSCPSWHAFQEAGDDYMRKSQAAFGALDAYLYQVKHGDRLRAEAEHDEMLEEAQAVVAASLVDNLDGLQFSLKSTGLVGAKIAQAIRPLLETHDFGQPPYCEEHGDA